MRFLLEILSVFDWISPSFNLLEGVIEGDPLGTKSWTFFFSIDDLTTAGWSLQSVQDFLEGSGVRTTRSGHFLGRLYFDVPIQQANWAEYLLIQNNIPLLPAGAGAPRVRAKKRRHRTASQNRDTREKKKDMFQNLDTFFDDFE